MASDDNAPYITEIKRLQGIEDAVREYLKYHPLPYNEDKTPSERKLWEALKMKSDVRRT